MPGKKRIMGGEVSSGSQFRDPSIMVGNTQKRLGKQSGESRKPLVTLRQTPEAESGQEVEPGCKASRLVQQWPIFSRDTLPPEGSTIFQKQRYQLGTLYMGVRGMVHSQTTAGFILAKPWCPNYPQPEADSRSYQHTQQQQPPWHTAEFPAYLQETASLAFVVEILYGHFKWLPYLVKMFRVATVKDFSRELVCHVLGST